ncbi:SIS domain-containing protein [Demetria terragena]|uniref:SIS domain-containing protein n=1 Tax=Demetria terragena TaxID=63959 RepID=UPI000372F271|nr:SIS domain-containing protein [Demetria terragena]
MSARDHRPGSLMAAEIAEQPTAWRRLLESGASGDSDIARAAALIRAYRPRFVLFVARGTSDHAALYAKYLAEITLQLPCGLVSPSTMTAYGARPDLTGVLMIGVSQSGGSPDLVQALEVARSRGALTVAVTNNGDSPLATAAEAHVHIHAGPERAVAATKSYTCQLLALHLLIAAVRERATPADTLCDAADALIDAESGLATIAQRYRFVSQLVTTGRGYSYPTAREGALKLMETCYISAQAFSGADLLHGPLAMIDPQVPVLTIAADGIGGKAMSQVFPRLAEQHADVFCVGTPAAVAASNVGVALPSNVPEELSPIVEIIPFQQLALHVALARGGNPDSPRGLQKVTETL